MRSAARSKTRRRQRVLLVLVVVCAGCLDLELLDFDRSRPSDPRLLDRACRGGECTTEGRARAVGGITADAIAYEIGPGAGSVTIPLEPLDGVDFVIELLMVGNGAVTVSAAEFLDSFELSDEPRWYEISGTLPPRAEPTAVPSSSNDKVQVVVAISDEQSRAELHDLRASGLDYASCSISMPGRRVGR